MYSSLLPYRPERDAYLLLGVPSTASPDEVGAACRRLARTFHPDRNRSTRATAEMAVVNDVRRVMIDPATRAEYDRERRTFHERRARAIVFPATGPILAPAPAPARSSSSARVRGSGPRRYLVGVIAGFVTAVRALAPPRCRGCRAVIATGEDAFCAACGTPLLTSG
ncbi:MAG TPA: DnaJ domain-containing protein [Candidatus Limnocylindria bacterium]